MTTVRALGKINSPATTILLADSLWTSLDAISPTIFCPACFPLFDVRNFCVGAVHDGGANVAFLDGHVKWYKQSVLIDTPTLANDLWGHYNQ